MKYFKKYVDISNPHSTISKVRKKRCKLLLALIHSIDNDPIHVLDIGGTLSFWETCGFMGTQKCEITLLNLSKFETPYKYKYIKSVQGNGTDMKNYKDKEFDLVVSDSVIEHVGDYKNQKKMAREIQRVGKRYFVQTPNFFFLMEPLFFVSVLSVSTSFPEGVILKEKLYGMTNSFIAVGGCDFNLLNKYIS